MLVLLAAVPTAASANYVWTRTHVLVAYGTGTTTCTVTVSQTDYWFKDRYEFDGTTDCSAPLQQTGLAWMDGDPQTEYGTLCSGFRASCSSGSDAQGQYDAPRYHVTLIAPFGQGWLAPPSQCSGAGSDNLDCTF